MHLSESAGDLGPGSILKGWAQTGDASTQDSTRDASERMFDPDGLLDVILTWRAKGRKPPGWLDGKTGTLRSSARRGQRERSTSTSAIANSPMLITAFTRKNAWLTRVKSVGRTSEC